MRRIERKAKERYRAKELERALRILFSLGKKTPKREKIKKGDKGLELCRSQRRKMKEAGRKYGSSKLLRVWNFVQNCVNDKQWPTARFREEKGEKGIWAKGDVLARPSKKRQKELRKFGKGEKKGDAIWVGPCTEG